MSQSSPWDLTECMERLRAFRDARDWAQFHNPKDLAAAIAIEAAELQELFLWKPATSTSTQHMDPESRGKVESELADIMIFAMYLADEAGIDIAKAVVAKVKSNEFRYDKDGHRGIAVKATPSRHSFEE